MGHGARYDSFAGTMLTFAVCILQLPPNRNDLREANHLIKSKCIYVRSQADMAPDLTGASMVWAGHADQKFIAYPISQRSADTGKSLVNWIAELRVRGKDDADLTPPKTDWTKSVSKSVFEGPFATWRCGGLEMKELIDSTSKVFEFPMSDRTPIDRWSYGRLTLLGDAAHAMYPIGSNGASQAIIDAETEQERLPPTAKIVWANRANGPDHVLQLAEERAPDGFSNVYDVILLGYLYILSFP